MEALTYLTGLALLFILGMGAVIVGQKLRICRILPLLLVGIILANIGLESLDIFSFPPEFMVGLSLLTLAMIVFDGTSRFTLQELDRKSNQALELVIVFIACNIIFLGGATLLLFLKPTVEGFLMAAIFSVVMSGTDPGSVFIMLGETKHKVLDFLRLEAILNTPLIVIIPFLLLDVLHGVTKLNVLSTFADLLVPFLQQVVVGLGTGMLIGIFVFRVMRKHYSKEFSPLIIMATTILTYVVAENLRGNGVVGVATLGLLFGNTYVKRKARLTEFSTMLSTTLEILVFILLGMLVIIDFSLAFFLKSLLLFLIAILARYIAILISTSSDNFTMRERIFMTLNMPKGIAVAVVTLTLSVLETPLNGILTLMILFLVYSLILSSITDRFGKFFIRKEILPDERPAAK